MAKMKGYRVHRRPAAGGRVFRPAGFVDHVFPRVLDAVFVRLNLRLLLPTAVFSAIKETHKQRDTNEMQHVGQHLQKSSLQIRTNK